jgi:threonine synthase
MREDSTSTCVPSGEIKALLKNVILKRSSGATGAAEAAIGKSPRTRAVKTAVLM